MKKGKKIALIVLAAAVVILGAIMAWQWKNIKAVSMAMQYSESELESLVEENESLMGSALDKLPDITFNPLTEDERKRLRDGEISEQEAVDIVSGKMPDQSDAANTPDPVDKELEANKARVAELIATVYVMRDTFTSQLEAIKNSAAAEYLALPKEERTSSAKMSLALRCVGEAGALEAQCDASVNAILAELKQLLPKIDGDLGLVDELRAVYANEKAVKKAYYISIYS